MALSGGGGEAVALSGGGGEAVALTWWGVVGGGVTGSRLSGMREWVPAWSRRRWAGVVVAVVLAVVLIGAIAFYLYFGVFAHHAPAAVSESVRANENVTVDRAYGGFVVRPVDGAKPTGGGGDGERVGVIFYPGGRVAPDAYLPSAARIVERTGATVFVPKMTANLAVLSPSKADAVVEGEDEIDSWVVGGHSLGGAMACRYAGDNPERVDGLLLVGAYCDQPVREMPALAVVGSRDVVLDRERFAETQPNLPEDASIVRIDGMNHSQAGWYSGQRGGQSATISNRVAHDRLAAAVSEWLCTELDGCSVNTTSAGTRAVADSESDTLRVPEGVRDSVVAADAVVADGAAAAVIVTDVAASRGGSFSASS